MDINNKHTSFPAPTERDAIAVCKFLTHKNVIKIERFLTGTQHYVYDVLIDGGTKLVIRIAKESSRDRLQGAMYWHKLLTKKGVPLPQFLFTDLDNSRFNFPVIVMERLSGKDLGEVYKNLSVDQKKTIARQIANIQIAVGTLPPGSGFGYARSYEDKTLKKSWLELLEDHLDKTEKRIMEAGVFDLSYVNEVKEIVSENTDYLTKVQPVPFLDDTTTKNVIVYNGKLSGIVDVDFVCFGDQLFVVSLAQMGLLASGYETDYIDYWCEYLKLNDDQRRILTMYTMVHCVGFMSEMGHSFNKDNPEVVTKEKIIALKNIFNKLLERYDSSDGA